MYSDKGLCALINFFYSDKGYICLVHTSMGKCVMFIIMQVGQNTTKVDVLSSTAKIEVSMCMWTLREKYACLLATLVYTCTLDTGTPMKLPLLTRLLQYIHCLFVYFFVTWSVFCANIRGHSVTKHVSVQSVCHPLHQILAYDMTFWWGRLTALWASVSPFP